jgi:hypothetical protein
VTGMGYDGEGDDGGGGEGGMTRRGGGGWRWMGYDVEWG